MALVATACACAHAAAPQVSIGRSHALALDDAGKVYAWGSDSLGQLGQGRQLAYPTPRMIANVPPLQAISTRFQSVIALATDGTVWTWGSYHLGERSEPNPARPGRVLGLGNVVRVEAGFVGSVAMRANGEAWRIHDSLKVRLPAIDGATSFAVGSFDVVAVKADGTVVQVGGANNGQLGPSAQPSHEVGVPVVGLPPMARVYAFIGDQYAGIDRQGQVWTWGCWFEPRIPGPGGRPHRPGMPQLDPHGRPEAGIQ